MVQKSVQAAPQDPDAALPFDPDEWERRLAEARARRAKALEGRAARRTSKPRLLNPSEPLFQGAAARNTFDPPGVRHDPAGTTPVPSVAEPALPTKPASRRWLVPGAVAFAAGLSVGIGLTWSSGIGATATTLRDRLIALGEVIPGIWTTESGGAAPVVLQSVAGSELPLPTVSAAAAPPRHDLPAPWLAAQPVPPAVAHPAPDGPGDADTPLRPDAAHGIGSLALPRPGSAGTRPLALDTAPVALPPQAALVAPSAESGEVAGANPAHAMEIAQAVEPQDLEPGPSRPPSGPLAMPRTMSIASPSRPDRPQAALTPETDAHPLRPDIGSAGSALPEAVMNTVAIAGFGATEPVTRTPPVYPMLGALTEYRLPRADSSGPEPMGPVDVSSANLVVHAPPSVDDGTLATAAAALVGEGFSDPQTVRVSLVISRTNVRYFHSADAPAAQAAAQSLGAALRDFTSFRPVPPAGTIEIWLAGRPPLQPARQPLVAPTRRHDVAQPLEAGRNSGARGLFEALFAPLVSGNGGPADTSAGSGNTVRTPPGSKAATSTATQGTSPTRSGPQPETSPATRSNVAPDVASKGGGATATGGSATVGSASGGSPTGPASAGSPGQTAVESGRSVETGNEQGGKSSGGKSEKSGGKKSGGGKSDRGKGSDKGGKDRENKGRSDKSSGKGGKDGGKSGGKGGGRAIEPGPAAGHMFNAPIRLSVSSTSRVPDDGSTARIARKALSPRTALFICDPSR